MTEREQLIALLKRYPATTKQKKAWVAEICQLIEAEPNCFKRSNLSGHVTGSAWVMSPDGKKILMTHHKKLNRWFQLGGHSDGEVLTWKVALREATEESGIAGIELAMPDIFEMDVHSIPGRIDKNEPRHKHYDLRFLLKAPTENFVVSEESNNLKWMTKDELLALAKERKITRAAERMVRKFFRENG